jgi:hypothetical protein
MKFLQKILLAAFALLLAACSPQFKAPRTSPNGELTVFSTFETSHRDENAYGCVIVELQDKSGKTILLENTGASAFKRYDVVWISNGEFKLTSADIGDVIWKRQPDGKWKRQ